MCRCTSEKKEKKVAAYGRAALTLWRMTSKGPCSVSNLLRSIATSLIPLVLSHAWARTQNTRVSESTPEYKQTFISHFAVKTFSRFLGKQFFKYTSESSRTQGTKDNVRVVLEWRILPYLACDSSLGWMKLLIFLEVRAYPTVKERGGGEATAMTAGAICVRTSRLFWSFLPCRFLSCAAALLSLSSSSSSSCCCCCSCCLRLLSSLRRRTTPTSSLSPPLAAAILASDSGDDLSLLLLLLLAACINPTPHKQLCDAGDEDAMTVVASPSSLMPATTYPPGPLLPALGKASALHNTHQKKQSAPLLTTLQRFFPLFFFSFSFSPCLSLSLNSYNNSVATTKNRPDPIIKSSNAFQEKNTNKKLLLLLVFFLHLLLLLPATQNWRPRKNKRKSKNKTLLLLLPPPPISEPDDFFFSFQNHFYNQTRTNSTSTTTNNTPSFSSSSSSSLYWLTHKQQMRAQKIS